MVPHLLRCQELGVGDYTLALGRLEAGAPATFAQLGFYFLSGSTVDRQQAYDPQGVCDPEYFSKRKQELHNDPQF